MRKYGDDTDLKSDRITTTENNNCVLTIKCTECGEIYQSVGYSICPHCNPTCPECGRIYNRKLNSCPHCRESKQKASKSKYNNPNLIICSKCSRQYNKLVYEDCPHCKKSKSIGSFKRYNGKSDPKVHTEGLNNPFHKCPKCGKLYNKNIKECPYCKMSDSSETSSNKHFSKTKYKPDTFEIVSCPKCGKKKVKGRPCSYCTHVVVCSKCAKQYNKKHKGEWVTSCPHCGISNIIECRKCGKEYNKIQHELCPYCGFNQRNDKAIFAVCIALIIIFIMIMMFLF